MEQGQQGHYELMESEKLKPKEKESDVPRTETNQAESTLQQRGLSVIKCALFIVGQLTGGSILALPKAIQSSGWLGIVMLIASCFMALYCGIRLSECWTSLRSRYPSLRRQVRNPYPVIAKFAYGTFARRLVEICLVILMSGVAIVFLLLASQNISTLVNVDIPGIPPQHKIRVWTAICALCLVPVTILGTPINFWQLSACTSFCASLSCILIISKAFLDMPTDLQAVSRGKVTITSFVNAFGTMAFSFGGAGLFLTFQTDMRNPKQFPKASTLAFVYTLLLYLPTGLMPYLSYGTTIKDNIVITMTEHSGKGRPLTVAVEVLITGHILFALVIALNPVAQLIEEAVESPKGFGYKRVLVRTSVMASITGVAVSVSHFGPILSLIGGSCISLMCFIFPLIFHYKLADTTPLFQLIFHIFLVIIAVACGGVTTYSSCVKILNLIGIA